jgi:GDPmannose 4,6-dehydratase
MAADSSSRSLKSRSFRKGIVKSAIVTGVSGQDGAYLAKLLLEKGYQVHGTFRPPGPGGRWRLRELGIADHAQLRLMPFDFGDPEAAMQMVERLQPDEIYNLAGQSSAVTSLSDPIGTARSNALGPLHLLNAIQRTCPKARFFQAGSAELFGNAEEVPQNESTPFCPNNPYGVSKLFAHFATVDFRNRLGVFGVSGLLYNHESPLRGADFVSRKIASSLAALSQGREEPLEIGNLSAVRDWGYAPDFVEGMWQSLQVDNPDTYVFATGSPSTVRDFVFLAARATGFDLDWRGSGLDEVGIDRETGKHLVRVNARFYRPEEGHPRIGSAIKARRELGWVANTGLAALCDTMVEAEIRRLSQNGVTATDQHR